VHPDIRQGSSKRGAIDLTLVARELLCLRHITDPGSCRLDADPDRQVYAATVFDAVTVALPGRICLDATPEAVLRRIWEATSFSRRRGPLRVEERSRPKPRRSSVDVSTTERPLHDP